MEKWYTNWRFNVNQDKSYHTTFTLKMTPCPKGTLYGIQIPFSPNSQIPRTSTRSSPNMDPTHKIKKVITKQSPSHTKFTTTQKYTH